MLVPQTSTPNSLLMALLQGLLLAFAGLLFFGFLLSSHGVQAELTQGPTHAQQTHQSGGWK